MFHLSTPMMNTTNCNTAAFVAKTQKKTKLKTCQNIVRKGNITQTILCHLERSKHVVCISLNVELCINDIYVKQFIRIPVCRVRIAMLQL